MAIAVVNSSVNSIEAVFPGQSNEVWYRVDNYPKIENYFVGGDIKQIEVAIETVSKQPLPENTYTKRY